MINTMATLDEAKINQDSPEWWSFDDSEYQQWLQSVKNEIDDDAEIKKRKIKQLKDSLIESNSDLDQKIVDKGKKVENIATKADAKSYIEKVLGSTIDNDMVDDKTVEVISSLHLISKKMPEKKEVVEEIIKKYIEKIKIIEQKLNEYQNDAVRLLCDVRWIDYSKVNKENFIVKRIWANVVCVVNSSLDFIMIEQPEKIDRKEDLEKKDENTFINKRTGEQITVNWWCSIPMSKIGWLESTFCLVNWEKFGKNYEIKGGKVPTMEDLLNEPITIHETRHNFNDIIFTDDRKESKFITDNSLLPYPDLWVSPEFLAKQEMIAFISDWSSYENTLKKWLEKSDWTSYNYFLKIRTVEWEGVYTEVLKNYQKWFIRSIKIMKMVQQNEPENHLNLLSITPIKDREMLLNPEQKKKLEFWQTDPKEIARFDHFFETAPKDDSEVKITKEELQSLWKNMGGIMKMLETPENIDFKTVIFVANNTLLNEKLRKYISWKNDIVHFTGGNLKQLLEEDLKG